MWPALMDSLDDATRARLEAALVAKSYGRDRAVFREGERGDSVYIVDDGHLLVERVTHDGDVVAVGVVQPGEIVGEQALVRDAPRLASVRTITPVRGWMLHRSAFDEARHDHPALDRLLVSILDERVRHLHELVTEARHIAADERLRRRLRTLSDCFDGEIPLTQQAIATMTGTTRPTVNAVLQQLRREGTVELRRGRILVLRADLLDEGLL